MLHAQAESAGGGGGAYTRGMEQAKAIQAYCENKVREGGFWRPGFGFKALRSGESWDGVWPLPKVILFQAAKEWGIG